MGALGNLDQYMKFKTAQAMEKAAENQGGGGTAGIGVGLGAGMTMANMMMGSMQQNQQQTPQNQNQQNTGQQQNQQSQEDVLATIEKLAKLKELGALTQEEFDAKKKDLLSKL
jgi:membrane protease subunit (stomatin/prohibitin family)